MKTPRKDDWEIVSGQFECLELLDGGRRCVGFSLEAKYLESEHLLTWKCEYGHISSTEYKE